MILEMFFLDNESKTIFQFSFNYNVATEAIKSEYNLFQ